jgi:glycosyltransferase involved in cell wall biosynthesis
MTEMSPKVTVVMSVYNEAGYISTAIESILKQTFEDFEFLIIDDGSTDRTPDIIKHYVEQDDRIKYLVNQTNKGLPASLNRGIELASGKYIARMDADDISLPSRFKEQVEHLDSEPDTHVVGSYTYLIGLDGEFIGEKSYPQGGRSVEQLKEQGPGVVHPSVMMRRTSLQRVNGYREPFTYAQDLDLWIRMADKFGSTFLQIIPEPLLKYRVTPDQYSRHLVTEIYESYVGEYIGRENKLEEHISEDLESQESEGDNSRAKIMYHYRVGRLLVDQGKRSKAIRHFLRVLLSTPLSPHGWYGMLLVCLPSYLRERVMSYVSK